MSDEQTGTPPAAPEAPVEPALVTPTPPLPQKFEGKTPEELATILQKRDEVIGRQGQELGQLREAVERLYAERSQERPPERGEPRPKFDYENPDKSVDDIVEARLAKEREAMRKERMADLGTRTTAAFLQGRESMKQNPTLYEGIEDNVGKLVAAYYGPQLERGMDVSHHLVDPGVWETAAIALRVRRGELDKLKPAVRKGMTAEQTDLPSQTRPAQDDDGLIIEDSDRQAFESWKGKKGTDKEIKELLKMGIQATRNRR